MCHSSVSRNPGFLGRRNPAPPAWPLAPPASPPGGATGCYIRLKGYQESGGTRSQAGHRKALDSRLRWNDNYPQSAFLNGWRASGRQGRGERLPSSNVLWSGEFNNWFGLGRFGHGADGRSDDLGPADWSI